MKDPQPRWTLALVRARDLLGFQGEVRFDFTPGLQVLEAPNHTGKTSLAMAVLWGLTGLIPKLDRLNLKSFRLWNKHAGDNATTNIVLGLVSRDGRRMEIRRRYVGRTRDVEATVEVTIGDEVLVGDEADARILDELGLSPSSLEGCGVVLQDHRLKLITGKDSEISEVVNDMLGLEALSEVVPMLEQMSNEADQLRKEIEAYLKGGNPLQRWQEDEKRLVGELRERENEALASGLEASSLEDPQVLVQSELATLAADAGAEAPTAGAMARNEVERLRKRLGNLRKESPHARVLAEVSARRPRLEDVAKSARTLADKWRTHDEEMAKEVVRGELDASVLTRAVAECDAGFARIRTTVEEARGEQELLQVAYEHLLRHPDSEVCPVCLTNVPRIALSESVKSRLDVKLAAELERLAGEEKDLKAKKKRAEKRLAEVAELRTTHDGLVRDARTQADRFTESGLAAPWALEPDALFSDAATRASLVTAIDRAAEETERSAAALLTREKEIKDAMAQQEESIFQPIEKRVNRVRDVLIPLLEAAEALEAHGKLRDAAEQRSGALEQILRDARDMAGRLKKVAAAVTEEESARATAAVQARLPFVSDFFARVAGNPDFTGLDIQTSISRSKVAYSLRTTSSKMAALGDVVGHVLSEGDMSAAGMALLLGLATGESHRLGFLLLDDPAQGMDTTLQRNFARELAHLEGRPQIVILTHQSDFAEALAAQGAERRSLGRWEGGRLQDG
jgi:DNA repair exonuclease SbcCD ATPase subunit